MEEERVVPTEKGQLLAEQLGMYMTYVCACVHVCVHPGVRQMERASVCLYL